MQTRGLVGVTRATHGTQKPCVWAVLAGCVWLEMPVLPASPEIINSHQQFHT